MINLVALKAANEALWKVAKILPNREAEVDKVAERLCAPAAKARYELISQTTGVPWFIIAVIHEREASQNFDSQLGQGDSLNEVSRHRPKGMGPYYNHPYDPPGQDAFYRCAVDTLQNTPPYAARWKDWTVGGALTLLVLYNGTGYFDYHGWVGPYDWGATDQERYGKYTGDGIYNSAVWDNQIGCAAMLMAMIKIDPSVKFSDQ